MTKKDFSLIAAALRASQIVGVSHRHREQFEATVVCVADALGTTNPRFDRVRFVAACGLEL
jgi:hypothetical protein